MMRIIPTALRCYARPEGDHYLAFCLELGLCDRGPTLEAAKAALEEDLVGYLESLTAENVAALFPRRAAWYVYLDYYRVWCVTLFSRLFHGLHRRWLVFAEPLVVTPRLAHGALRP